jgi:hypothetical protein
MAQIEWFFRSLQGFWQWPAAPFFGCVLLPGLDGVTNKTLEQRISAISFRTRLRFGAHQFIN